MQDCCRPSNSCQDANTTRQAPGVYPGNYPFIHVASGKEFWRRFAQSVAFPQFHMCRSDTQDNTGAGNFLLFCHLHNRRNMDNDSDHQGKKRLAEEEVRDILEKSRNYGKVGNHSFSLHKCLSASVLVGCDFCLIWCVFQLSAKPLFSFSATGSVRGYRSC